MCEMEERARGKASLVVLYHKQVGLGCRVEEPPQIY